MRQLIVDALVNTGRFAVLDREFSPELQQELDLIESGQAPAAETAKLRQAASADVLWIGKVHSLAYNRHARQLRTSDRELVLTRLIDAPRAALYRAWTEPELIKQWFVPKPWSIAAAETDVRAGGSSLMVMRDPEGNELCVV